MPGWDGEAEGAQGWGKAAPLSGEAEGPERGLGRAGCAGWVVAAPGHQAEGQRDRGSVEVPVLEPGAGRGADAGVEGAAGEAGAQTPLVWDEGGAQSSGLKNLWASQEKSGAGRGELRRVAWPPSGMCRARAAAGGAAPGSGAGEEQGQGLAVVLCGWRWGPGCYLLWWWLAESPRPTQRPRTGEVGLRAGLQPVGWAPPPHRDCSPCHAAARIAARGPALVCRPRVCREQVQVPGPPQGALGPGGPWAATSGQGLSRYQAVRRLRDSGVLGLQSWGRGQGGSGVGQPPPGRCRGAGCAAPQAGPLPPLPRPPPCGAAAALGLWAVAAASSSAPCRTR